MAKGRNTSNGENGEIENGELESVTVQPLQFRNPNSLVEFKDKRGKRMPAMTVSDYLKPENFKQLPEKTQDKLTGKTKMKTASQLLNEQG